MLLALAQRVDADLAIALDPDADRCAVGIPTAAGWRMLSGDETGWLLGDFLLSRLSAEEAGAAVVASSLVSSQLLADIAARISSLGGNVIEVQHQQLMGAPTVQSTELHLMVEVRDAAQGNAIIAAREAGVNNYIVKPFTAATLKEKLDKIFERIG